MLHKWNVDDRTLVEARIGTFGRTVVSVNGVRITGKFTTRKNGERPFQLPDGRPAALSVKRHFGTRPDVGLIVNGRQMVETGKKPMLCEGCGVIVKPNDRFCIACGRALPTAETMVHRNNLRKATRAIAWLALLFVVSGVLMFFMANQQADKALANLASLDANAIYPKQINGHTYTVAELRKQIVWDAHSILIVNGILAAVMAGLAVWGRRAPLPAILIATATYAVITVTNAIIDPTTIGQGVIVKFIVIGLLVRGIKAALALRTTEAGIVSSA